MTNCAYIHIPFCEKKCRYCSFCSFEFSLKKENLKKKYLSALAREIKACYKNEKLKTLYLGGGTPSLLSAGEVEGILSNFNFDRNCEITIEINPNSFDFEKLKAFINLGINRFSIGVQSFDDEILKNIGRLHTKNDVLRVLDDIKKSGIDNYSIDLIYGLPGQNISNWVETLEFATALEVPHISFYGLKIEEGSYFYKFPPDNLPTLEEQAKMYEIIIEKLKGKYLHYEFSNFAKSQKYFSKHNLSYWTREEYYGFGLSASGFLEGKRYVNTSNFRKYIEADFEFFESIRDYEILTKEMELEEEIFLRLRMFEGLNINRVFEKYGVDIYLKYKKIFDKFINDGFLIKTVEDGNDIIRFSQKGILVSNEILCEFVEV